MISGRPLRFGAPLRAARTSVAAVSPETDSRAKRAGAIPGQRESPGSSGLCGVGAGQ